MPAPITATELRARRPPLPPWRGGGAALLAAAMLAACAPDAPPEAQGIDAGARPLGDFRLTDHGGRPRSLADFRGKVVVLFFGFTQCPDVCPTTLSDMAQTLRQLGPEADRVQVLFVTIDPERDTRELLAQYVPAFDPRFLGLSGDAQAIARAAESFEVSYAKVPGRQPGHYTLDHTAYAFVIDRQGRLRLKLPHGQPPSAYAQIIRELLADG